MLPWRRKWQPTPVFLPGESHAQRLVGYNPWGCKKWDTNEATWHTHNANSAFMVTEFSLVGRPC